MKKEIEIKLIRSINFNAFFFLKKKKKKKKKKKIKKK